MPCVPDPCVRIQHNNLQATRMTIPYMHLYDTETLFGMTKTAKKADLLYLGSLKTAPLLSLRYCVDRF